MNHVTPGVPTALQGFVSTGQSITGQSPSLSGKFGDIRSQLSDIMNTSIPDGRHVAVFMIAEKNADAKTTATVGFATKIGDHWQVAGDLGTKDGKHAEGEVLVNFSF